MKKFRVRGTYEMCFYLDVDMVVEADDKEEALEAAQDRVSAGQAYDQDCRWVGDSPVVSMEGT